ncbi:MULTISPECIES: TRAP transporter substrate-binding protein [Halomonadaceae]|uniref:TRAP transporter substrate-binding protein n=1 Tax=Halomonadaceae TaxID=28256 RepID=UPI0012F2D2B0|nr:MULTISPECIES: TRAP transporter substrate-binding protein DctP [Halomonas]CAD5262513.1 TRAP-type C4-dicarboxylate transport system, periplasmic component [Halomonas sp. 113]CAD5264324.1 TRAP-type C4-dicarboxylate transport system, periplasmic component [Halomonas sp. 59]CAD5277204.1 TRAP-type C4-dicarboxylate transport system, periplasmic component [Halomonas sp. I3]CAD5285831.1 TRAP-type C4-dicarboxylate transport system, periplasmic component [Halomonas sp. 156]VXB49805.1 TRAP-type C4-dica
MKTPNSKMKGIASAVLLGSTLSMASMAQAVDLNVVLLANEQDEEYDAALVFENYVESRTGGEVDVNVFVGPQLCGSANECFEAMQAGVVDLFTATAGGVAGIYPPIQGMDIPYIFPDDRTAMGMLSDPELTDFLRGEILESTSGGIRLMTMTQTGGWRNFANSEHQIKSPEDIEGLRFRTIESEIQQNLVREMGGSPTPLPWLEVYTGLQTGVVDGTKNSISDITSMNFQEVLKHITLDGHAYMASMWLMGNQKFQSMTPEQQRVVADATALMGVVQFGMQPRKELEAYEKWKESGGELYTPNEDEMEQFRSFASPIRDWYLENYGEDGEEFLNELEASRERAASEVESDRKSALQ